MALSANLTQEIALATEDPYHYLFNGIPYSPDATLYTLLGGDVDKYDLVLQDGHAKAVLEARTRNVVMREWEFKPASSSAKDKKAAEVCKEIFEGFDSDQMIVDLMETTLLKGNSFNELTWDIDGKTTYIKESKIRPTHRFRLVLPENSTKKKVGTYLGYEIRVLKSVNWVDGDTVPEKRILCHSYGRRADNPLGVGLGSVLYWLAVVFKKEIIKQRLVFLDKYAAPTPMVETTETTTKEQRKEINRQIAGIVKGGALTLPYGCKVSFLEAQRSSTNDVYETSLQWCDDEMSKMVLGETLSLELPANTGSRAAAETHQEGSTVYLAKYDSDRLSMGPLRELAAWATDLNVPGAKPPTIWKRFPELDEVEDLDGRVQRDSSLNAIGYKITPTKLKEVYGDGYEDLAAKQAEKQNAGFFDQPSPESGDTTQEQSDNVDLGFSELSYEERKQKAFRKRLEKVGVKNNGLLRNIKSFVRAS